MSLLTGIGAGRLIEEVKTDFALIVSPGERVKLTGCDGSVGAIERFLTVACESGAGLVYSDFVDQFENQRVEHPTIDYQIGSIRDTFEFGPAFLISRRAAEDAVARYGSASAGFRWAGLYDLRLKLSVNHQLLRIPEYLYARAARQPGNTQFDYVDPRRREHQIEMEEVATAHLKRIGALIDPVFSNLPQSDHSFPVRASVVIPVRNRERTIADAVNSALSQAAEFHFNVIVVDNHSTDRTTRILDDISSRDSRLVHLVPSRTDLGIGGCWNQAIYSMHCGQFAVQLDSDDLYRDEHTLARLVAKFEEGPYAMVIGSYTIVDFGLNEIPPGLIDHREWTSENGRNNALRVNGLGAPRAFHVPTLRRIGFPNVSYGEDYAVGLRISREYEIGRIFDSLYFARRWEGNSDALLDQTTANRYDSYKDRIRTFEVLARQRMTQR
jgi:hypothetical protein